MTIKHSQNQIDFLNNRFESLVENGLDCVIIISATAETTYVSRSIINILGYTPDEVIEMDIMALVHPDDVEGSQEAIVKAIQNPGVPIQGHLSRVKHKNGSWIWIDAIVTNMLHDPSINGIVDNFRDVTDRVIAEEKANESSQRLLLATQVAKIGIWEQDLDNNHLKWNDIMYELYGVEKHTFDNEYTSWLKLVHPDDQKIINDKTEEVKNGQSEFHVEFSILRPDGSIRYIKSIAHLQKGNEGKPARIIGTNWDITTSKNAEVLSRKMAALEAKSEEMEQLSYITSHDLREPLLTMKQYSQVLHKMFSETLGDDGKILLETIIRSADRMEERINDLLNYSQLGQIKNLEQIDCNSTVQSVIEDLNSLIESSQAQIIINDLPIEIKAYPTELQLIFQNLINNAIKFREKDTRPVVHISSKKITEGWEFQVADNGIGIDEKDQKKIFSIFKKLHNVSEYKGSGIGLAHVKKLVELHNGQVWIKSKLEKGATFSFSINTENL